MASGTSVSPEELKELAVAMGCHTQERFAEALGVSQAYVSQLYSGQKALKPGPLLNLIRRLEGEYLPARKRRR